MFHDKVAKELVYGYYRRLNDSSLSLIDLYTPDAQLVHEFEGQYTQAVKGEDAIRKHLESDKLNLSGSVVAITSQRILNTRSPFTHVVVIGEIKPQNADIMTFNQSLLLHKADDRGVKIISDVFTLLKTEPNVILPAEPESEKASAHVQSSKPYEKGYNQQQGNSNGVNTAEDYRKNPNEKPRSNNERRGMRSGVGYNKHRPDGPSVPYTPHHFESPTLPSPDPITLNPTPPVAYFSSATSPQVQIHPNLAHQGFPNPYQPSQITPGPMSGVVQPQHLPHMPVNFNPRISRIPSEAYDDQHKSQSVRKFSVKDFANAPTFVPSGQRSNTHFH